VSPAGTEGATNEPNQPAADAAIVTNEPNKPLVVTNEPTEPEAEIPVATNEPNEAAGAVPARKNEPTQPAGEGAVVTNEATEPTETAFDPTNKRNEPAGETSVVTNEPTEPFHDVRGVTNEPSDVAGQALIAPIEPSEPTDGPANSVRSLPAVVLVLITLVFCAGFAAAFSARADVVSTQPLPQSRRVALRTIGLGMTDRYRRIATDETRIEHGNEKLRLSALHPSFIRGQGFCRGARSPWATRKSLEYGGFRAPHEMPTVSLGTDSEEKTARSPGPFRR
jgi:hypothetical protein